MFALRIEYLTGRVNATSYMDRRRVEWPPHPVRVFSALVSAMYSLSPNDSLRNALLWLEGLEPPVIRASLQISERDTRDVFVPVNDEAVGNGTNIADTISIPRSRQPRTFPSAYLKDPVVYLVWENEDPQPEVRDALCVLAGAVSYLGHSSSLVTIEVRNSVGLDACSNMLRVSRGGTPNFAIRVMTPGLLEELERLYRIFQETGVRLPAPKNAVSYEEVQEVSRLSGSVFGKMIILRRIQGSPVGISMAGGVSRSLREQVLQAFPGSAPEWLSGRQLDGRVSQIPHVAFVSLPYVGSRYADGDIMGIAAILPRGLSSVEERQAREAIGRVRDVALSPTLKWRVGPLAGREDVSTLRDVTWSERSHVWATVTPIELDRYPHVRRPETGKRENWLDRSDLEEVRQIVRQSVRRVGLPFPVGIFLSSRSVFRGAPDIHCYRQTGSTEQRPLVHALLVFDTEVVGPVLVGRGRYFGMGLLRPFHEGGNAVGC